MGLANLRKKSGLTLKQLAEKSGVNFMKIHQIERGIIKPENIALHTAHKLANALNCQTKDLLPNETKDLLSDETAGEN